ncbi:MAG: Ca2+-binding protein, RTX toxin-related [Candidatus Nitrotoga sp. LAW]|nr:MAG: Ca2+-binding protein, RTX toxin-related [Candidatus Nitrotoga sp. LAW]
MANAIELALMAGRVYQSTRDKINWLPDLSSLGWIEFSHQQKPSGFEAISFQKGNEIVISFAGTGSNVDWWANTGGFFGVTSTQLEQAADYYLQVKAIAPVGATISFTGHSMGGGLASLLAVFFGETAVTFDQAPFRNSASVAVANTLLSYLSDPVRGYSAQDLQGLTNFISTAANGGLPNEGNVLDFSVQGEILSAASALRIGSQTSLTHSPDNWFGSSVDLHSQALLTAFLQSDQTAPAQHSFRDVTVKLTDLLKMIFDSKLYYFDPNNTDTSAKENFTERLVRHQNGVAGLVVGETAIVADAMLTRFTADLWKIAQDGGLTLHDGNSSNPDLHELSKALIAFAMQKYYEETTTSAGYNKALFTDLSTANEGSNGIRFDMDDVSKYFALTLAQSGKGGELNQVKGYQDFLYYLNQTNNGLNADERQLIKSLLPYMRDWYVQAGASGMNAADTLNRGAFMLGGNGSDALVGGTKADLLVGNKGDDLLQGGKGNDILLGGKDNDSYVYTSGDGFDTIFDSDGNGSIAYNGAILAGGDQFGDSHVHRNGNGHLYVDVGNGRMVIDGNILIEDQQAGELGLTMAGPAAITTPQYTISGTEDNDDISIGINNVAEDVVDAGAGQDYVFASYGNDIIISGAGSDALDGFAGDDRLYADSIVSVADAIALGNTQVGTSLLGDALSGDSGDDTLIGSNGDDILSGGAGTDLLIGGAGIDYILGDTDWAAGTGRDWGVVNNVLVGGAGGIALWTGNTSDVIYAGAGADRVWGELGNDVIFGEKGADELTGGDGNDVILGGDDNDSILGDYDNIAAMPGNDYLDGGAGDDIIDGNEGDDIIIGGAGVDTLYGGTGKDTYIFNRGDGGDTVYDTRADNNIFRFGAGISSSDITLRLGSLMLDLGNGDSIHIAGFNQSDVFNSSSIGSFEFTDGSILTTDELLARGFDLDGTVNGDIINGTNATDRINGLGGNDSLFGMAGNDTLNGGDGNDQLVGDDGTAAFSGNDLINGDDGDDYIWGNGGDDTLNGGTGNDILQGETGNDNLIGGDGNDKLAGGAGNDTLNGGEGDDIYYYNLGEGIDHITDSGGTDRLVLGNGATIANLRLDVGSLKMVFSDGSELHLDDFDPTNPLAGSIEYFQFSDGQVYTREQMIQTLGFNIQGGSGDSVLSGTALGETITAYAGNDTVTALGGNDTVNGGAGNDTLYGDAGADNLLGGLGDDLLAGGADNDTLDGGAGNDTYLFGRDVGQDIVYDNDTTVGNFDKIQIAADVLPSDVTVGKNGVNLYLSISNPDGTTDKLTLANWYSGDAYKVEQVVFSNGTVWDVPMLDALTKAATQGDDIIDGSSGNDVLNGLGGHDTLRGYAGDDTLDGDTGNDSLYGGDGNDLLRGGAGSDLLQGDAGNDTLDGGAGDDSLYGNEGNDTYLFGRDSGQDIVQYYLTATDNADKVQIAAGLLPSDVIVTRDQNHLFLSINNPDGTTAKLTLASWFGNGVSKVGEVIFADGTVWDEQALKAMTNVPTEGADNIYGTSGDDVINGLGGDDRLYGNAGNDTLNSGTGNDYLEGNEGNDTYVFGRGYGNDVVVEDGRALGNIDTVQMVSGVLPGDVLVSKAGSSLILWISGTSDQLTLVSWFNGGNYGIDQVVFADGTTWDAAKLAAMAQPATMNADLLYGSSGNDNINGLGGDDIIYGYGGDDTLNGALGNDTLYGGAGNDTLIGEGAVDDLFGGEGNDMYVRADDSARITEYANQGIDTVQSSVTHTLGANFENITLTGTAAINGTGNELDNVLIGNSAKNTLIGNAGNDTLNGGAGVDTMLGGVGNDTYIVDSSRDVVSENANEGLDTVQADISYTLAANVENLTLTGTGAINATGNTVDNVLLGNSAINTLTGGAGNDLLNGGAGNDTLKGDAGNDVLEGVDGNDTLSDSAGNNLFNGGAGVDTLIGNTGKELFIGGLGNDTITTGTGADIIAFNKGDGQDTIVASTVTDNTISLGGGIQYANLSMSKSGNNLILNTGNGDQITMQNWYKGTNNHSVANLQLVLDAGSYNAGSTDPLLNQQIQDFNFALLAQNFDQALLANPTLTAWNLTDSLLSAHLSGSDTAALGGDLAYQYNLNGSLAGIGLVSAQTELGSASFGVLPQQLQPLASLQTGTARLG